MRHTNHQNPLVSVILPIYNAEKYLLEALESLKNQSYLHFEVIAIDDASTDNSLKILKDFAKHDSRFRIFKNKKNLMIARTLNFGITKAKGNLLARMDADDIALPNRFKKQVAYLQAHPGVVIVGGQCLTMNSEGHLTGKKLFPTSHVAIHEQMYTTNPIQHPTVMINRSLLPKNFVWYNKNLPPAEDLDLYFRLGKFGLFANLKFFVLKYRQHRASETFRSPKHTFEITQKVRRLAIHNYGYKPTLKAKIVAAIQNVLISVLPEGLIFPVYTFLRDTKLKETLEDLNLEVHIPGL